MEVESGDGKETFTIVGSAEASPREGRISNESPVGRALLGRKKGDKVVVRVPAGDFSYTIVSWHQLTSRPASRIPAGSEDSMDWADELAATVSGPQVVNDSKTPSGTVHVGSLRGVVLHDAIRRALRDRGLETTFRYGVDDLDPMDAQALLTPDAVEHEMGRPLAHVPAQPGSATAPSYARHFAQVFIDTFAGLGIQPDRYYWMSDIYPTGAVDPYIRLALDRADRVRDIYRTVSTVQHPPDWLPVHVICENCGRIGTTIATGWDGKEVAYECRADLVEWAKGCGTRAASRPSAAAPSCPGTSTGPPSGACSA